MELIDKTALVAEIEGKINKYTKRGEESDAKRDGYGMYWGGVISCLNEIRSLLDTLEVKKVDLEKEIYEAEKRFGDIDEMGGYRILIFDDEFRDVLHYFFELGLKAKKAEGICKISETNCPNFDEAQGTNFVRK